MTTLAWGSRLTVRVCVRRREGVGRSNQACTPCVCALVFTAPSRFMHGTENFSGGGLVGASAGGDNDDDGDEGWGSGDNNQAGGTGDADDDPWLSGGEGDDEIGGVNRVGPSFHVLSCWCRCQLLIVRTC